METTKDRLVKLRDDREVEKNLLKEANQLLVDMGYMLPRQPCTTRCCACSGACFTEETKQAFELSDRIEKYLDENGP